MDFCQKRLELRPRRGITQSAAAAAPEIALRQYQRVEAGEPGAAHLRPIAGGHGVPADGLMGRTERREVRR